MLLTIFNYVWLLAMFCLIPAGVLWLCRKYSWMDKIGPVMILYVIGLFFANIPMPEEIELFQNILPTIMVPLAIPMMLFNSNFTASEAKLQLKVVVSGFLSVCLAVVGGYLLFGHHMEQGAQVGGIITGMYTGGTLNAAALQAIFRIKSETYLLVNSYDIIILR